MGLAQIIFSISAAIELLVGGAKITIIGGAATAGGAVPALSIGTAVGAIALIGTAVIGAVSTFTAAKNFLNNLQLSNSFDGGGNNQYKSWADPKTLDDHYERHGKQVGASNKEDYVNKANDFYNNRDNYKVKMDEDGTIRVYDTETKRFGSYTNDGKTKTFFTPDEPNYWSTQPGVEISDGFFDDIFGS